MDKKAKGVSGEDIAEEFLRQKGYRIIERNFRVRQAEIDIIALDGEVLVFIEVKMRLTLVAGFGREAVTKAKQNNIRYAANYYIMKHRLENRFCRFDVVEITPDNGTVNVELIQNAF